jgi:hypothetical protein
MILISTMRRIEPVMEFKNWISGGKEAENSVKERCNRESQTGIGPMLR